MSGEISVSIFTLEADRRPIIAFQSKRQAEAEALIAEPSIRDELATVTSNGKSLCDDFSIFRIRLAKQHERTIFYNNAASFLMPNGALAVFLVDLDASGEI